MTEKGVMLNAAAQRIIRRSRERCVQSAAKLGRFWSVTWKGSAYPAVEIDYVKTN
jgi:hypothetical protein